MVKTRSKSNKPPTPKQDVQETTSKPKSSRKLSVNSKTSKQSDLIEKNTLENYYKTKSSTIDVDITRHRFAHFQPSKIDTMSLS